MKKLLPLLLATSLAWTGFGADASKSSVLQFRLVVPKATPDSEKVIFSKALPKAVDEELYVSKTPVLDGAAIQSAAVHKDNLGLPQISVLMTEAGGKQFAKITREHIGERLAIFVDGKPLSAPVIQSEISGGKAEISGNFSQAEAGALAKKLNEAAKR